MDIVINNIIELEICTCITRAKHVHRTSMLKRDVFEELFLQFTKYFMYGHYTSIPLLITILTIYKIFMLIRNVHMHYSCIKYFVDN